MPLSAPRCSRKAGLFYDSNYGAVSPSRPRSSVIGWSAVVALIALAIFLFQRGMTTVRDVNSPGSIGSAEVGGSLPDVSLVGLDGRPSAFSAFGGHPLWINFFATWCPPCKTELPEIERRYDADKAAGLEVLGVDQQESATVVSAFVKRYSLRYAIAIDDGHAATAFRLSTIPVSVFVD